MITLENYGESVVEKDNADSTSRRVQEGAEGRNTTEETREVHMETVYQDADRGKEPFVGSEKTPKIAGVLVVAQGADKTAVRKDSEKRMEEKPGHYYGAGTYDCCCGICELYQKQH